MLLDAIKKQMFQSMKDGDLVAKEILRVAVGEITTDAARPGRKGDDAEAVAILKKLVNSIEDTLSTASDPAQKASLERERTILSAFVPQTMGVDAIVAALEAVKNDMRTAANDGAATGIAMKALKASGANVNGKDVAIAVKQIRT